MERGQNQQPVMCKNPARCLHRKCHLKTKKPEREITPDYLFTSLDNCLSLLGYSLQDRINLFKAQIAKQREELIRQVDEAV